jgi:hypothetical protein
MPLIHFLIPPQGANLPPSHTSIQGLDFQSTHLRKFEVQQKAFRLLPTLFLEKRVSGILESSHTKEVDDD